MASMISQPIQPSGLGQAEASVEIEADSTPVSRTAILLHSLAFVIGFGVVFTLLGSAAGLLGRSLFGYQIIIQKVGAVLLPVFGLTTMGLFRRFSASFTARVDLTYQPGGVGFGQLLALPQHASLCCS